MFFGFAPLAGAPFGGLPPATSTIQPDARYARPMSDVSAGNWAPSLGASMSAMLSETVADMSTSISTSTPGACEMKLNPVVDPQTSSGQVVRYQVASTNGSGLTVRLKQGSNIIAQWTHDSLPTVASIYSHALTAAQCDSITDYTDLRFEFEAL